MKLRRGRQLAVPTMQRFTLDATISSEPEFLSIAAAMPTFRFGTFFERRAHTLGKISNNSTSGARELITIARIYLTSLSKLTPP